MPTRRIRGASPELVEASRRLRREETPAERVLWQALRDRAGGGLKFRRQHPVGAFVLDFFCPAHKLVVEVDGPVHDDPDQAARDAERTYRLEASGYRVLRFSNQQVLSDLQAVLAAILAQCKQ